jgi:hypothetical protein
MLIRWSAGRKLTMLVIAGLILTEVVAVLSGVLDASRLVPTWCLQGVLLVLFAWACAAGRPTSRLPEVTR